MTGGKRVVGIAVGGHNGHSVRFLVRFFVSTQGQTVTPRTRKLADLEKVQTASLRRQIYRHLHPVSRVNPAQDPPS